MTDYLESESAATPRRDETGRLPEVTHGRRIECAPEDGAESRGTRRAGRGIARREPLATPMRATEPE